MSEFSDSLRRQGASDFENFLLDLLSHAEDNLHRGSEDTLEEAYWQGRKDAIRSVLASWLNMPDLNDLSLTSPLAYLWRKNAVVPRTETAQDAGDQRNLLYPVGGSVRVEGIEQVCSIEDVSPDGRMVFVQGRGLSFWCAASSVKVVEVVEDPQ